MQSTDEKYMKEAIKQAKKAYAIGEVPIGCVIVYQDKIIGRGYNRRTIDNNTLAHAELIAIKKASKKMNLLDMPEFNHQVELTTGVMEEECSQMMKSFFKELREARKKKKQLEKEQTGEI